MACAVTGCSPVIKEARPESIPLSYAVSVGEIEKISEADLASRRVSLKAWYYQTADWDVTARQLALLSETEEPALCSARQ
jgi:hypothetical protein